MRVPDKNDVGLIKVRAWITDETFGYEHWRAAQFSSGPDSKPACLVLFNSVEERDEYYSRSVDEQIKMEMLTQRGK